MLFIQENIMYGGIKSMKKSRFRSISLLTFALIMSLAMMTGCSSQQLSSDFNEADVKAATENVINLINNQDLAGLKALCNVQMKAALTDDVLKQVYAAIGEGGKFVQFGDMSIGGNTDKSSGEEFAVVVAKAQYEIKTFTFTISFTKQMKLAGLYYK
jgi:hypothetical protein